MWNRFQVILQYIIPKQLMTRAMGKLADKNMGIFTRWVIILFVKYYKVNLLEAANSNINSYKTFNAFFARKLTEDARPILTTEDVIVFPADGVMSQFGEIMEDQLIQAKGQYYTLDALLGCNTSVVKLFTNGLFATTYLSPSDYHRVHIPCDATLREMTYIPGTLFSVNSVTTAHIPNVFARNERIICLFDTEHGPMVQILVGATIVGSIETVWHGIVTPPREGIMQHWIYPIEGAQAVKLKKGDEMGCFKMGSTVINLFVPNSITFDPQIQTGYITRVGTHFADRL